MMGKRLRAPARVFVSVDELGCHFVHEKRSDCVKDAKAEKHLFGAWEVFGPYVLEKKASPKRKARS